MPNEISPKNLISNNVHACQCHFIDSQCNSLNLINEMGLAMGMGLGIGLESSKNDVARILNQNRGYYANLFTSIFPMEKRF